MSLASFDHDDAYHEFADSFIDFIAASPSSFHAAQQVATQLQAAGFQPQKRSEPFSAAPGGYVMVEGGAVLAWWIPNDGTDASNASMRIIGAHTDSPGFKLKHQPQYQNAGWQQALVEVYGGPIWASWFDRELCFAGELGLRDGSTKLVCTPPIARIPHVAIHLDREQNKALQLDPQRHLQPIWCADSTDSSILELIAAQANVPAEDVLSHDLITVDAQRGTRFGHGENLIAAGRMDNLSSVYSGLQAMLGATSNAESAASSVQHRIMMLACFDHEEVGSSSTTGAAGPLLEETLERIAAALGANYEQTRQMFARSHHVSADAAHAVHPNHADKHDPMHMPNIGQGPVLKLNANQRYASNARSTTPWLQAVAAAGVPSQSFVGNNAVPCGSTIGPISATRLGIETVDVGIPLLSMHSARELAHAQDLAHFVQALYHYLVG